MTDRISRRMISLYASLSTFIVILITLFSYFHSIKQNRWLLELLQRKVFYLPLIDLFTDFIGSKRAIWTD